MEAKPIPTRKLEVGNVALTVPLANNEQLKEAAEAANRILDTVHNCRHAIQGSYAASLHGATTDNPNWRPGDVDILVTDFPAAMSAFAKQPDFKLIHSSGAVATYVYKRIVEVQLVSNFSDDFGIPMDGIITVDGLKVLPLTSVLISLLLRPGSSPNERREKDVVLFNMLILKNVNLSIPDQQKILPVVNSQLVSKGYGKMDWELLTKSAQGAKENFKF
jgi:hypothetical protein